MSASRPAPIRSAEAASEAAADARPCCLLGSSAYDQALEKLSVLLALQTASSPPGTPAASTPGPPNPPKRGRPPKNAVASRSSSISRASAPPPPPPAQPSLPPNHPANFPPVPSFHTQPLWKRDPKERKAELAAQLPLTAGRRVAFKVPVKPTGGSKADKGADAGAADEWILAIVRKIIGQDLGRCACPGRRHPDVRFHD